MSHLSAVLGASAFAGALAASFGAGEGMRTAAALAVLGFVAIEFRRLPMVPLASGLALGAGGLLAGGSLDSVGPLVVAGARATLPFLVIFCAVLVLQNVAVQSPSFRATGEWVVRQPPGRRYLGLAVVAHLISAVLTLAALQFTAFLLDPRVDRPLYRRLLYAIVRGYSAAAMWSPFFVGMGAVLGVLPGLTWLGLAPAGFGIAAAMVALAWAVDRIAGGGRGSGAASEAAPPEAGGALWRVAGILLVLMVSVVTMAEALKVSVLIANGLVAPVVAVVWQVSLARRSAAPSLGLGTLVRRSAERVPGLRNEVFLFLGANILGAGLAAAIEQGAAADLLPLLALSPTPRILVLCLVGTLISGLGIHPVVLVVVAGHILPAQAIGLSDGTLGLVLLVIWTTGTAISPFSATHLQVARILGVSTFTAAWRLNGPFSLASSALGGLLVAAYHYA